MMKRLIILFQLCIFSLLAVGQTMEVHGRVLDGAQNGEPMIGATVMVKGTNQGTVTDIDGLFVLQVPKNAVLVISSVGYKTQEVKANKDHLTLTMEEDTQVLDEFVVVGYGSMRKVDLTGSVGSITGDKLKESIVTNADQMLQGRVSGVQVTQNTGAPGGATSIRVRGASSITGDNEPLYIIDGVPMSGSGADIGGFDWAGGSNGQTKVNPLATISPQDIVSMDVLKDASACAIYGAAGANGVVIITTRRGEAGKMHVNYDGYVGVQTFVRKISMMNLHDYAVYQKDLYNQGVSTYLNSVYQDPSLLDRGTDWQDAVVRDALMHSHQISLTGGSAKTQFAISGGYMNQEGTVIGSNFERFSARANIDHEFAKWFKLGGSLSYARTNEKIINNDGESGILMSAITMQPDIPVKDKFGNWSGPSNLSASANYNPVAMAQLFNNRLLRNRIMGSFYGQFNFTDYLNLRTEYSFDSNTSLNKGFMPTYQFGVRVNNINKIYQREEHSFYWIWKNYLNYNQTIGKHTIGAMLGMEMSRSAWEGTALQKNNLTNNDIQVMGEDGTYVTNSGWKDASTTMSVFARANYNYDNRYLVTATIRGDASSKFGPEHRWGAFPSVALAWRISNEAWLREVKQISNLKLRVGYGQVGNSNIGTYLYAAKMRAYASAFGTSFRMATNANPDLKWEASEQWNLGVDFGMFNSRIDLSVDLYQKQTKDLLLQPSVPAIIGGNGWDDIATPMTNIGRVRNRGIDISLNTAPVQKRDFQWNSNLVISVNRNMVLAMDANKTPIYGNIDWYSEFQTATAIMVGQPMGVFYGFQTDGLFENKEDIEHWAVQVDDGTGHNKIDQNTGVWVGDVRFKDIDGDGFITDKDQTVIGDPNPDFTFGFTNNFSYKNWTLGIVLNGSVGGQILNYTRVKTEGMTSIWDNQSTRVNDRVQFGYYDGDNTNKDISNLYILNNVSTTLPRWNTTDVNRNNRMSDRWLESASFMRISNISLSYTFPDRWMKKIHIANLKLYANIQNVWIFTAYSGYDPEIGAYNQQAGKLNIDTGRYPSPRVYTFGLNLSL